MESNEERRTSDARWDRRLNDLGWGLLLILTGLVWLLPPAAVPSGTWLFGVAIILFGVNIARYVNHLAISMFSLALGVGALIAAISQIWRTDPPLMAIFLVVIGASLLAKSLSTRIA